MTEFAIFLLTLFFASLVTFRKESSFSKEKMPAIKIFMAIVIVLGHLSVRIPSDWIQPFRFWGAPFVSMFLFMSGYGMWQIYLSHSGLSFTSVLKRVWKLALPYLLTVCLYFIIVRIPSGETDLNICNAILTGTSKQYHLWFVFAIVYLYLAFYLCTRFRSKPTIIVSLFVLVSATIILLRQVGYDRCWWVSLLAFPTGCLYSMYKDRINGVLLQNRLRYCFAMTAAVAGVGVTYLPGIEVLYSISHLFIPIVIALLVIQLPIEKLNNRFTLHLGAISYEIYLCQLIAMDGLQLFFPSITPLVYVLSTLALTVVLAELVYFASHICSLQLGRA